MPPYRKEFNRHMCSKTYRDAKRKQLEEKQSLCKNTQDLKNEKRNDFKVRID